MENFNILKSNKFYQDIFDIIVQIGIDKLDANYGNSTISFCPKNLNSYQFELVFWLNENRISLNILDWYEIIDSYLFDDNEAFEVFKYIDTIFRNIVVIEEYGVLKSHKIYKKNIEYTTLINGEIIKLNSPQILGYKYPWTKIELLNRKVFIPLY